MPQGPTGALLAPSKGRRGALDGDVYATGTTKHNEGYGLPSWRITENQQAEVRRLHADGLSICEQTGMAWAARLIIAAAAVDPGKKGS